MELQLFCSDKCEKADEEYWKEQLKDIKW